jgi:hypothetical protein
MVTPEFEAISVGLDITTLMCRADRAACAAMSETSFYSHVETVKTNVEDMVTR